MDITLRIEKSIPQEWDSLVGQCTWGSFYHSSFNHEIIKEETNSEIFYITASIDGILSSGIACAVLKGKYGTVVNCLPYFGSYGDALILPNTTKSTEEALYKDLLCFCRKINAVSLTIISSPFAPNSHHDDIKAYIKPTFTDERTCQTVLLPNYQGEGKESYTNKILSSFQNRARTAYRKALSLNFESRRCQSESEAIEFANLHIKNMQDKGGSAKSIRFFKNAFDLQKWNPENCEIIITLDNGIIISGVLLYYFNNTVEYHSICVHDSYRSEHLNRTIIANKMIQKGMEGFKCFNFGGTWKNQDGVYQYKKSFGAKDFTYSYYTVIFNNIDLIKNLSPETISKEYPLFYLLPFSELNK